MKAFLVRLSGHGRTSSFLINQETWDFLQSGAVSTFPEYQMEVILMNERGSDPDYTEEDAEDDYLQNSTLNERANFLSADEFDGDSLDGENLNSYQVQEFLDKHDLVLEDTYEGRLV